MRTLHSLTTEVVRAPLVVTLIWIAYRRVQQGEAAPRVLAGPFAAFRVLALIGLAAALAGCSNSDPLAVASGPVFQLNPGHWQPSRQALAAPPPLVAE
jgi:hypothetical protein